MIETRDANFATKISGL